MEDLLIAYYFVVIMIGFAALAIAGFWAFKTGETDLYNFCIVYVLFTLILIVSVFRKYLSVNVEGYTPREWYDISGIYLVFNSLMMPALLHFVLGIYQIPNRKPIAIVVLVVTLLTIGLIYSPLGAVLDAEQKVIHLGVGLPISSIWYLLIFTSSLLIGYGYLPRIWTTDQKNLVVGLLVFASFGYIESLLSAPSTLRTSTAVFGDNREFLYSSIPYTLFGLFIIYHFLNLPPRTHIEADSLSESFITAYGITDREREIIMKVIEGKSNATIASELVISLATVKTHLHNIYTKLGVESRFDLLARVRSGK